MQVAEGRIVQLLLPFDRGAEERVRTMLQVRLSACKLLVISLRCCASCSDLRSFTCGNRPALLWAEAVVWMLALLPS